jgi:hypothetical protein
MFSFENGPEIETVPSASEFLGNTLNIWDNDSALVHLCFICCGSSLQECLPCNITTELVCLLMLLCKLLSCSPCTKFVKIEVIHDGIHRAMDNA